MSQDDLPTISPNEAAIFYAYGRLVAMLERTLGFSGSDLAQDLQNHVQALPEAARPLMLNLANSLRPTRAHMRIVEPD